MAGQARRHRRRFFSSPRWGATLEGRQKVPEKEIIGSPRVKCVCLPCPVARRAGGHRGPRRRPRSPRTGVTGLSDPRQGRPAGRRDGGATRTRPTNWPSVLRCVACSMPTRPRPCSARPSTQASPLHRPPWQKTQERTGSLVSSKLLACLPPPLRAIPMLIKKRHHWLRPRGGSHSSQSGEGGQTGRGHTPNPPRSSGTNRPSSPDDKPVRGHWTSSIVSLADRRQAGPRVSWATRGANKAMP